MLYTFGTKALKNNFAPNLKSMDCYRLLLVSVQRCGGDSPVVERRAGDRKVEVAKCRSALGKDTLGLFPIRDKQSIRCGGPACQKACKHNSKKCSELLL